MALDCQSNKRRKAGMLQAHAGLVAINTEGKPMTNLALERATRELHEALKQSALPAHMHAPIARYVIDGIKPGNFLCHVIENNLHGAAFTADDENIKHLRDYARFFFNHVPPQAYGNTQRLRDWCKNDGLSGLMSNEAEHA